MAVIASRQRNDNIFFFVFALLFYLDIPLLVGGVSVPNFTAFIGAIAVFFYCNGRIEKNVVKCLVSFFFVAAFSALFVYLISGGDGRLKALLLLLYSFFIGYSFFLLISRGYVRSETYLKLFFILLVGSFLEVNLTYIQNLSNSFGEMMHPFFYTNDERDILLGGGVRPKFFSSEPSHLAKFGILLIVCWALVSDVKSKMFFSYLLLTLFMAVINSATLIFGFIILMVIHFYNFKFRSYIMVAVFVVVLPSLFIVAALVIYTFFGERISSVFAFEDTSTLIRLVLPVNLAVEALKDNLMFGVGFGGRSLLFESYMSFVSNIDSGGVDYEEMFDNKFNNLFWEYIQSFGLLFSFLGLYSLRRTLLRIGCDNKQALLLFMVLAIFSQSFGGLASPRFWSYFFILSTSLVYVEKNKFGRK